MSGGALGGREPLGAQTTAAHQLRERTLVRNRHKGQTTEDGNT